MTPMPPVELYNLIGLSLSNHRPWLTIGGVMFSKKSTMSHLWRPTEQSTMPPPTPRSSAELPLQLDSSDTHPHSQGSFPRRVVPERPPIPPQSRTRERENHSLTCAQSTRRVDEEGDAPVIRCPIATRHGLPGPDDSKSAMAYGHSTLERPTGSSLQDQESHIRARNRTTDLVEQSPSHAVSGQRPPSSPEQPVFDSTIHDFAAYSAYNSAIPVRR